MKIIFAGTPEFAAVALDSLLHSNHDIVAVYTQPDKPAGRGLKLTASPVKVLAQEQHLPVYQPATLKEESQQQFLDDLKADVMVVAAYGMLLPAAVLRIPRFGCINIHPSLLPRWRGAAPIQRTLFAGDKITGVTIMQMDTGLDTGPILLQRTCELAKHETSQTLHDKLARLGALALMETLHLLEQGKITPTLQDNAASTYANKISKEEALIDWMQPAIEIEHQVCAFNPWPVAYTSWQGQNLRVWLAEALPQAHQAAPRTILQASRHAIDIATGKGALRLLQVQLPGSKVISVSDFYNSKRELLVVGQHFL